MSEGEAPTGLTIAEKFLGLLLIFFGAILLYYTIETPDLRNLGFNIFIVFAILLIVLGIFIVLSKAE
jgi:uncharacterized membrane protein YjjP (DUF1212 family)